MAQGRIVKSFTGFRTRISDWVVLVHAGETPGRDLAGWKVVIAPGQAVWVGDAPFEPGIDEPRPAGEWGRVGPPSSSAKPRDVASIPAHEPLSEEDASARSMIAANPLESVPGSPTSAGGRME